MATENEQLLEEQARLREKEDRKFMRQALTQAKKAAAIDEVPIGCVIVCDGKVIARGYNRRNIEDRTGTSVKVKIKAPSSANPNVYANGENIFPSTF